jgi:hypothetical protein
LVSIVIGVLFWAMGSRTRAELVPAEEIAEPVD